MNRAPTATNFAIFLLHNGFNGWNDLNSLNGCLLF
jgi:hypothetical protein